MASHGVSAAPVPEAAEVTNIGFVLHTKSPAPGTLNARWMYSTKYRGPGITNGKLQATDVGMEVENGLAVGWRSIAD